MRNCLVNSTRALFDQIPSAATLMQIVERLAHQDYSFLDARNHSFDPRGDQVLDSIEGRIEKTPYRQLEDLSPGTAEVREGW